MPTGGSMIRVSVDGHLELEPYEFEPPQTADSVIEAVATQLEVAAGSLKAGQRLFTGKTAVPAGDYVFKTRTARAEGATADIEELRAKVAKVDKLEQQYQEQQQQQRRLELLVLQHSQTTQTEQQLGAVFYDLAPVCPIFPGLPAPDIPKLENGCKRVIKQWQDTGMLAKAGRTGARQSPRSARAQVVQLMDLVPEQRPSEAVHMQPLVMQMLSAVSDAVGSSQHLFDTHSSNFLKRPTAMIDCCGLASTLVEWTQLVVPYEFKLRSRQVVSLLGQLIDRCEKLFHHQRRRQHVYAVGIMLDAVEVFSISCNNGKISVERTGLQPLSIASGSPGLRLLASVLQASLVQLGYSSPQLPPSFQLGNHTLSNAQLIQEGSAPCSGHPGSYVFRVTVDALQHSAILKLSHDDHEEFILKELQGLPHVVQLQASGLLAYESNLWHAVLLQPYGRLLEHTDPRSLIVQVTSDVVHAISDCASKHIAHRDVTANNFVNYQQRGYLCDFTAAKVIEDWSELPSPTGNPAAITGTPLFAAVSVLEGGPHTQSSMYEGLFYSLLYICRGGRLPDSWAFKFTGLAEAAKLRRGCMMCEPPINTWDVPEEVAPFIRALHALFWAEIQDGAFKYRTNVTAKELLDVCSQFMA